MSRVHGWSKQAGQRRFALPTLRARLIQMFAAVLVLGSSGRGRRVRTSNAIEAAKKAKVTINDLDLDLGDLKSLVDRRSRVSVRYHTRRDYYPAGARAKPMDLAVTRSSPPWNADRAILLTGASSEAPPDLGHGGPQSRGDGVRQPRHGLGHRGGVPRETPGTGSIG